MGAYSFSSGERLGLPPTGAGGEDGDKLTEFRPTRVDLEVTRPGDGVKVSDGKNTKVSPRSWV